MGYISVQKEIFSQVDQTGQKIFPTSYPGRWICYEHKWRSIEDSI